MSDSRVLDRTDRLHLNRLGAPKLQQRIKAEKLSKSSSFVSVNKTNTYEDLREEVQKEIETTKFFASK